MTTASEKMSVSVIMPALNEQENICAAIDSVLEAFSAYEINGEIIVVDDASTDRTPELARQRALAEPRLKLISHKSTQGIGASFREGAGLSRAEAVVMIPGDNENNPNEILRYFRLLEYVDMVVPFLKNRSCRGPLRNLLSGLYTAIINLTFFTSFNYTNGTVLYRKKVLGGMSCKSKGFFYQTEILIKAVRKGYSFAEAPYTIKKRGFGRGKSISLASLWDVFRSYLRLAGEVYLCKS